jgi:hypothetical protein
MLLVAMAARALLELVRVAFAVSGPGQSLKLQLH